MKYLHSVFMFFIPVLLQAQSVSVTAVSSHSGNNQSTFPLHEGSLVSSNSSVRVNGNSATADFGNVADWAISPEARKAGVLTMGQALSLNLSDYSGKMIIEKELEFFDPSDETLAVYLFDDGRAVVRDNVANFSFFDASGDVQFSVSNSSQSADGERESQLVADASGRTVVLYNPVIAYGNQTGSQARVVFGEQSHEVFYRSRSQQITHASVTRNGAFIVLVTGSGGGDRVMIFDRFGNELAGIDADAGQKGAVLTEDGRFLTIYSSGRAQVYNVTSGERVGSTSSRTPLIYAAYQSEDETIVMIGGSETASGVSNPNVTAVNVAQRQIARGDVGFPLSVLDNNSLHLERRGANQYRLSGLNRHLDIRTSF